jgi:oligopeptide/dipeptide ABC transporter ATP-binding protein
MGVVAETADKVATMYAGQIVEYGTAKDIFYNAKHPYLEGLKKSIPHIDDDLDELSVIKGIVPDPLNLPQGCRFEPRCERRLDICREKQPPKVSIDQGHYTCCWLYGDDHGA